MPMATRMVVDNATVLANYFAMSELTIGLTVVAIGTSLPELATAIAGLRKGENDIAVGNIIGANIFNIVIVLGLPALITPGEVNPMAFVRDYSVMLLVSVFCITLLATSAPDWSRRRRAADRRFYHMAGDAVLVIATSRWITGNALCRT